MQVAAPLLRAKPSSIICGDFNFDDTKTWGDWQRTAPAVPPERSEIGNVLGGTREVALRSSSSTPERHINPHNADRPLPKPGEELLLLLLNSERVFALWLSLPQTKTQVRGAILRCSEGGGERREGL